LTALVDARVTAVLARYAPDVLVQSIVRGATVAATRGASLDHKKLLDELRARVRLFVEPALQPAALREVELLDPAPESAPRRPEMVLVNDEGDVCKARIRAREIAMLMKTSAFGAQRASTAVSELARNMVLYAAGGTIELIPVSGRPPRLTVRASDRGPGIADLEHVLGGSYRSSTGLGRGLSGVKRLASRFDVRTGPAGTIVEATLEL
jgi:serine/threonine-protein kinase RsbT